MSDFGWNAKYDTQPLDLFARKQGRLYIWRHTPDGFTEVRCEDGTIVRVGEGAMFPPNAGLVLLNDEWEAIERAVSPAAHDAELRRVEEALTVERGRVDAVLATLTPPPRSSST